MAIIHHHHFVFWSPFSSFFPIREFEDQPWFYSKELNFNLCLTTKVHYLHCKILNLHIAFNSQAGSSTLQRHLCALLKYSYGDLPQGTCVHRLVLRRQFYSLPYGDPTALRRVQTEPFTFMFVRDPATHVFAAFDNIYKERKRLRKPTKAYEMFGISDNEYVAQHVLNLSYVFTFSSCTAQHSAQSRWSPMHSWT